MIIKSKWLLLALMLTISAVFLVPPYATGSYVGTSVGDVTGNDTTACLYCHNTAQGAYGAKSSFLKTGHPYKFRYTGGATPTMGTDPLSALLTMPNYSELLTVDGKDLRGTGTLEWSKVEYVIGGFGWKARWGVRDTDATNNKTGFIWSSTVASPTGAQFNMLAADPALDPAGKRSNWSTYGGTAKKYSCAVCHNTDGTNAYSATSGCNTDLGTGRPYPGTNNGGYKSEWTLDGVQCEACHGQGSSHAADPSTAQNVRTITNGTDSIEICAQCHIRSGNTAGLDSECGVENTFATTLPILKNGACIGAGCSGTGFIGHHEQYNEMMGLNDSTTGNQYDGVHASLTCSTCHDPHKRTSKVTAAIASALGIETAGGANLAPEAGAIKKQCSECHSAQVNADAAATSAMKTKHALSNVTCVDCHMAEATQTATGLTGTWGKKGDLKTHVFKIATGATDVHYRNNAAGKVVAKNAIPVEFACGKCHDSNANLGESYSGYSIADKAAAAGLAAGYHSVTGIDNGYVGSNACAGCHETKYDDFVQSGHPYKVRMTNGKTPFDDGTCVPGTVVGSTICDPLSALLPTPDVTALWATVNGETKADLGVPASGRLPWANISYVIGGYMSKARWGVLDTNGVGTNNTGYVWSSSSTSMTDNGMGAQFNMEQDIATPLMQVWSAYGDGAKKYNCAACHNTNGVIEGNKECGTLGTNLGTRTEPWASTGMTSTNKGGFYNEWTFSGVQCEACHGAAKNHVSANATQNVLALTGTITGGVIDTAAVATGAGYEAALSGKYEICAKCHIRGTNVSGTSGNNNEWGCPTSPTVDGSLVKALTYGAPASGNWISHHEQYNEMIGANDGAHKTLSCTACHDPHKRAHKVTGDIATALGITDNSQTGEARGAVSSCGSCHDSSQGSTPAITSNTFHTTGANCVDCHMGEATKSGPANGEVGAWGKRADVKTHIFAIDSSVAAGSITRANPNPDGTTIAKNALPVDYSCGKCHDSSMSTYVGIALTRPQAQVGAAKMHGGGLVNSDCATCHTYTHTSHTVTTTTTCTTCHTGTHGTIPLSGTMADCAGCHTPTGHLGSGHDTAPYSCTDCHTTPGVIPTESTPTVSCNSCHAAPAPPTPAFTSSCNTTTGVVTLNAVNTSSTCPSGPCAYDWDTNNDGTYEVTGATSTTITGGGVTVVMKSTGANGLSATVSKSISTCSVAAVASCGTATIAYPGTLQASLNVSGQAGTVTKINWGDTHLTTPSALPETHTYAYASNYTIFYTVTNGTSVLQCTGGKASVYPAGTKRTIRVNVTPTPDTTTNYTIMKITGGTLTGPLYPQCNTFQTGTCALNLPATSGYTATVTKYGKTYTCTVSTGTGTGGTNGATAIDTTSGPAVLDCN